MEQAAVEQYAQDRVPRYTSYPTAPRFTPAVDEAAYRGWLAAIEPDATVSLYLHVPFCQSLCWYCGCHTKVPGHWAPVGRYLDALGAEIALVAAAMPRRMRVLHLHWGGGTPTMMGPEKMTELMALLRRRFAIGEDAELAIEIDPRRLPAAMVATIAEVGINRASLGVQSFAAAVQRAINREQSFEETRAAVAALRGAGIDRINLDLVYGLPHQTVQSCRDTAALALALAPDRLAVFGYAHVPAVKPHQRRIDETALPDAAERRDQAEAIAEVLTASGYRRIGLDHFARPGDALLRCLEAGRLRRNFQGYTTDQATVLIGLGASAIGSLPQGYVQNTLLLSDYGKTVAAGRLPIARGVALDTDDRFRRDIIEQLMCYFRADLREIAARHGRTVEALTSERAALAGLADRQILRLENDTVSVPEQYRALVRVVAAVFDTGLDRSAGRHALAI